MTDDETDDERDDVTGGVTDGGKAPLVALLALALAGLAVAAFDRLDPASLPAAWVFALAPAFLIVRGWTLLTGRRG